MVVGRPEVADYYADRVLRSTDPSDRLSHLELLRGSLNSVIYGPTLEGYISSAAGLEFFGDELSAGETNVDTIADAINLLAQAALNSESVYTLHRPGVLENPEFIQAIRRLQRNVAEGVIELMPEEFAMIPEEGRKQVTFADEAFTKIDSRAQLYLAGLNYATFTGKTMCSGKDLLEGRFTNLQYWTERGIQEAMPHLVISNIAIGEVIAAIFRQVSRKNIPLRIIDTGSGSGATLGATVLGLAKGLEMGGRITPDNLGIVGIEGVIPMFKQLEEFSEVALRRLNEASSSNKPFSSRAVNIPEREVVQPNELVLISGDIAQTLEAIGFSHQEAEEGITVVTANYSWHRIPTAVKDRIIKSVLKKTKNVIFLIADLTANGSEVNRRYFNFRDNGLLNCGNIRLSGLFYTNRVPFFALNQDTAPSSMSSGLARKIGEGTTSDSLFYVAHKGPLAEGVVKNW